MTQTTNAIWGGAAVVEISADGLTWTDISGHATKISPSGGDRQTGQAYTFDGEFPIVKVGKMNPRETRVDILYTEQIADAFELVRTQFVAPGGGSLYLRWNPSGDGVTYMTDAGFVKDLLYPEIDSEGTGPVDVYFVVQHGSISPAYDWYVDSVSGSDSYAGTLPTLPFATVAKLVTVLSAGESVGLAKGSTWHEQLDLPGDGCRIAAYGSGSKPLFDCSDPVANAGFTKTGGRTYVYQATISPALTGQCFNSVWENNVRLVRATDLTNCDATAGSYYPTSETTAPITMYIHASDGSSVITNGRTYDVSMRQWGIGFWSYSGCSVDGIQARRGLHNGGMIRAGRFSTISNCLVEDGNSHNMLVRTGSVVSNTEARYAYNGTDTSSLFVYNEDTPNNEGITFTNCTATMAAKSTLVDGFYGHKNTSGSFGTVTFTNCTATKCLAGFSAQDASLAIYTGCTISGGYFGINCNGNTTITNCNIFGDQGMVSVASAATVTVTGSTLNQSGGGVYYPVNVTANNVALNLSSTTVIGDWYCVRCNATGFNFTSQHNDINVNSGLTYYELTGASPTLSSDYNLFDKSNVGFNIGGTTYASLALYKAGTGQDAHSTVG